MDSRIPTTLEPSQEVEKNPVSEPQQPPTFDRQDVNVTALGGFFHIQEPDNDEEGQMKYIINFFEKHGVNHMAEILLNVKNFQMRLGAIPLHLSPLQAVYNYIKTQAQIELLTQEKHSMEQ